MDPHAENRYHISPYAWCSNNPINRIDLDGLDDEFDKEGYYLRHIDNGTDFVMVQNANGEFQNITEFSYCEEDLANRAMLSNVMTYYGKQVGLDQTLDVCDVEREGAMAVTDNDSDFHQVYVAVINGKIVLVASTGNNIMNSLVHEKDHVEKGINNAIAELYAIVRQMSHPSWAKTTSEYKKGIIGYLAENANQALRKKVPYNIIENILQPLGSSCPIWFHNDEFTIVLPDLETISNK